MVNVSCDSVTVEVSTSELGGGNMSGGSLSGGNMTSGNMTSGDALSQKYEHLQEILGGYDRVIVAYSGGVDSVFLLKVAVDRLGVENVLACLGVSESLARSEYAAACRIAEQIGASVEVVHPREMANPHYRANPPERCYHCKAELYSLLNDLAGRRKYDAVLCGTNLDDLGDFRPGLEAAKRFNVASPLEQAKLTKDDIRALSRQLKLTTWNKPAQPCLASRMAYGLEITPDRLKQIERGEDFLRGLGLTELRVRHHGDLVRIEVRVDRLVELIEADRRERIVGFFKGLGFVYVTFDMQGFRSGSANEVL